MTRTPHALALVAAAAALATAPAHAVRTTTEGGIEIDFNTTLSLGAQVRLSKQAKDTVGNDNGGSVPTGARLGALMNGPGAEGAANPDFNFLNGDDGNLNYKRGDIVSAPLKGNHEFGLKTPDGWRALVRASWLKDFKTDDTRRTRLSDDAKDIAVTNWTWLDAWVSKDFKLGERSATVRVGNQVLSWGEDIFVIGGINQINAFDLRKLRTPGAQVKEILRPAPMISLNAALTDTMSAEAYYQWKWNAFRFDPVGTFFSGADVVGAGQRPAYIPSSLLTPFGLCVAPTPCGDNGAGIQDGINVVPFERDKLPPKGKQFGVALRMKPKGMDAEFGLYYQRYHDKLPFTTLFTDPAYSAHNVVNIGYRNEYGQDKDLFGASFNTKVGPVAVGGELSYRPKDSVAIDPSVPGAGAYSIFDKVTPGPTKTVSGPAGAERILVRGYVEEKKVQAHLTALYFTEVNSPLGAMVKALGAAEGTLLAEVAVTHYPKLQTGTIPYLVFPSYAVPTKTSWGYAAEFDLSYPHVWGSDWNLTQVTVFTHDVSGISPNALPFVKGRKSLFLGLNFDKDSVWKVQLGYAAFFGGGINNIIRDRDNFAASLSYSF